MYTKTNPQISHLLSTEEELYQHRPNGVVCSLPFAKPRTWEGARPRGWTARPFLIVCVRLAWVAESWEVSVASSGPPRAYKPIQLKI